MLYIANAFSLQMIDICKETTVVVVPVDDPKATVAGQEFTSAVGHADTANLFSGLLGVDVPSQRINVKLTAEDALLVGQYIGPRLPEGATTLPEGASIVWLLVTVK
jgi:hypothetical protein